MTFKASMNRSSMKRLKTVEATVACAFLAGCGGETQSEDSFLAQVKIFGGDEEHAHAHSHGILAPLDQATWVAGRDAKHLRPDDPILGYLGGADGTLAFALPWWVMKNHHVANLELSGTPVCITLCERCSSAAAWDPRVDGRLLHLRVRGIYDGTHICFDDTTGSWFTPFLGMGMSGPLAGLQLTRLRLDQAMWADWLEIHPESQVIVADEALRAGHGSEEAPGSAGLGHEMRQSIRHPDDRLPENEIVLGVVVGGDARAYPMKALSAAGGVLNDVLGGVPIVVLHKPGTWLAAAFRAELDGRSLAFELAAAGTRA
ncbi:MAG: DUF3179 domain-containing protein, partial [Planctomycetes bacterium]|nr:DUF3179 domain-containing protein [Planctomycetota bacterium]